MKKVKLYWKKIVVAVVLIVLFGFVAFMYLKLTELTNQLTYLAGFHQCNPVRCGKSSVEY